jgi:hypothetical protein
MRRSVALLLATAFILLGAFVFPAVYLLWMIQRPELVARTVDPGILYALTVPGVVIELEKDRGVRALDGTVLELDRKDISRIVTANFTEEDVIRKAQEAIQAVATTMDQAPPDTFQFFLSLKDERPVVNQYLVSYFRHKLRAQPECSMGKVLGLAWMGIQKLFGKRMTEDEQLQRLPHCRPPGEVQNAVMKAVAARLHRSEVQGPDSIRVRPNFSPRAHVAVRRILYVGQAASLLLPILPLLLGGILVLSWENRRNCYARVSAPLIITALILLLISVPVFIYSRDIDLFAGLLKAHPMTLSESTGQWLRVTFYLVKGMMRQAAYNLGIIAGMMLALGLILLRMHRRCEVTAPVPSSTAQPELVAVTQR